MPIFVKDESGSMRDKIERIAKEYAENNPDLLPPEHHRKFSRKYIVTEVINTLINREYKKLTDGSKEAKGLSQDT